MRSPTRFARATRVDPRRVVRRAEEHLRGTGIADTCFVGPECEFFVFDQVSYDSGPNAAHYSVDSSEGYWNSGRPGLGYTSRPKEGYFPTAPHDSLHDPRTAIVPTLERLGIPCEFHHHEVASGGQCEIDLPEPDPDGGPGDDLQVRGPERRPRARQVRHLHAEADLRRQRLWDARLPVPLEGGDAADGGPVGYAGLSQLARAYVGGLLEHAPALLAFCAPTTNSYRRLGAGLRGAGEPRLLAATARPVRSRCTPTCRRRSGSSSAARRGGEPIPRVRGDADGRDRRDRARSTRRACRLRPLRGGRHRRTQVPGLLDDALDAPRPTTRSCSAAASSAKTRSGRGSTGSGSTRSTSSGFAPIRPSSASTTTAEEET